ncbi:leucine-rich repeat-containing protein 15-like [Chironomus tepperi]|uniref:leucine-rich repeat-containing protein 15-like n=1 Tax=Chironomus tepperi TaxID=113505 RepID=UPI00391FBC42
MELKLLVLLSVLFGSTLGQSLTCTYSEAQVIGQPRYICTLNIQNPTGLDDFTEIGGTHLEGRTNADVTGLYLEFVSRTINFPRIICSQFPNLEHINYSAMDVVEINENTFSGCQNLAWLRLWYNEIEVIHERAFASNTRLSYLDLDRNQLTTLPENVFLGLANLDELELSNNPFISIPSGLFNPLISLRALYLIQVRINSLNPDWFAPLGSLEVLSVYGNNITVWPENTFSRLSNLRALEISRNPIGDNLPVNIFRDLTNLQDLYMARIEITEINPAWFQPLGNLETLFIYSNRFISIPEGAFDSLTNLLAIDIGDNHLPESAIPGNLFRNMPNLLWLICDFNLIQTINPEWFQTLTELVVLDFNFNHINELQEGVFTQFREILEIDLWNSNLKTIHRNAFGNIGGLIYLDLDGNNINAIDERFLLEVFPLSYFYFRNNLCASDWFYDFGSNREQLLPRFATCTRNYEFIVETATELGAPYRFYIAPSPGIQFRVTTNEEVRIALTPVNFLWTPSVEIIIGARNNTVSTIVRNQGTEVVVAHSPNIIRAGFWTGLRVTWANHVILVSREGQNYPFLAYNLQDIFPVQFYGISSPQSRAVWSIQPVEADIMPTDMLTV